MPYVDLTSKNLEEAKALIGTPDKWTKDGFYATDIDSSPTEPTSGDAVCWCVLGAVASVTGNNPDFANHPSWFYKAIMKGDEDACGLADWNDMDHRTHADVMAGFDRAIAAAKAREAR